LAHKQLLEAIMAYPLNDPPKWLVGASRALRSTIFLKITLVLTKKAPGKAVSKKVRPQPHIFLLPIMLLSSSNRKRSISPTGHPWTIHKRLDRFFNQATVSLLTNMLGDQKTQRNLVLETALWWEVKKS
jgi:hypothetical protein